MTWNSRHSEKIVIVQKNRPLRKMLVKNCKFTCVKLLKINTTCRFFLPKASSVLFNILVAFMVSSSLKLCITQDRSEKKLETFFALNW